MLEMKVARQITRLLPHSRCLSTAVNTLQHSNKRKQSTFRSTSPVVLQNAFRAHARMDEDVARPYVLTNDLPKLLGTMGVFASKERVDRFTEHLDSQQSGKIFQDEFVNNVGQLVNEPLTKSEWRDVFAMIDLNNNGVIEVHEIMGLLSTSKSHFTRNEALSLIHQYDRTGKGTLCFEDFIDLVTSNSVIGTKLLSTYRVIFVTGGPGSGKGTVCNSLLDHVDCAHISSGDLLRHEIQSGSLLGQQIESTVKSGGLVDASTVVTLLDKTLAGSIGRYVLLDGFPRSTQNALDFYEIFGPALCVLSFECPDEVMIQRISDRGKTSGRTDDNIETAKRRITTFHQQAAGPMQVFKQQQCPIITLDSTNSVEHNVDLLLELPMFKSLKKSSLAA